MVTLGEVQDGWVVKLVGPRKLTMGCVACSQQVSTTINCWLKRTLHPCGFCSSKRQEQFWALVDRVPATLDAPSPCWSWAGHRNRDGYGQFSLNNNLVTATHLAWYWTHGRMPTPGMVLMHACDHPWCVNPAHLSEGTYAENMADRGAKGHTANGLGHGRHTRPEAYAQLKGDTWHVLHAVRVRGEHHGMVKITREQALTVRRLYVNNLDMTQADIAAQIVGQDRASGERSCISQSQISDIVNEVAWAELHDGPTPASVRAAKLVERDQSIKAEIDAGIPWSSITAKWGVSRTVLDRLVGVVRRDAGERARATAALRASIVADCQAGISQVESARRLGVAPAWVGATLKRWRKTEALREPTADDVSAVAREIRARLESNEVRDVERDARVLAYKRAGFSGQDTAKVLGMSASLISKIAWWWESTEKRIARAAS